MSTRLLDYIPNTITDPKFKDFLHHFYEISNNSEAHEEYADCFTNDAEMSMNGKKAKGRYGTPPNF